MDPIDSKHAEGIGWHLIARGGDMTARVHPSMRLGILPSGDLSFEAPDAVIELDMAGEGLALQVVADDYELETEAGERTRTIRVSPRTHVCLDFLGHTLDIDNDFAIARPAGDALALFVVRKGEPRTALGPLSAPPRLATGDILVPEKEAPPALVAVPIDSLQRDQTAERAKRQAAGRPAGVWKLVGSLAAALLVITGLVSVALWVANQAPAGVGTDDEVPAQVRNDPGSGSDGTSAERPGTEGGTPAGGAANDVSGSPIATDYSASGLSADVLARLSDLLEAEPLPDKTTIDFAVESLRSLMAAYPDDARVPAALARLNERLVVEARQSYDRGDAFRAGRLIEQATSLGMAGASVAETLDHFEQQPPGQASAVSAGGETEVAAAADEETVEVATPTIEMPAAPDDGAEAELMAAVDRELTAADTPVAQTEADPGIETEDGLDSLVESATGLALGALAGEVGVEDTAPMGPADADNRGPLSVSRQDDTTAQSPVENQVQSAFDSVLREASATPTVSANDLPAGFALEESGLPRSDTPSATAGESPSSDPAFRPYSELTPRHQVPLVYPRRAAEGTEGSIEVEFIVTDSGDVTDVNVRGDAPSIFLRDATRTIRQWRFEPVLRNGEPVPVRTALRITYRD